MTEKEEIDSIFKEAENLLDTVREDLSGIAKRLLMLDILTGEKRIECLAIMTRVINNIGVVEKIKIDLEQFKKEGKL